MNKKLFLSLAVTVSILFLAGVMNASAKNQDGLIYTVFNKEVIVNDYIGSSPYVKIPTHIEGYPVTTIGSGAFTNGGVKTVTIPYGVTTIADEAFYYATLLTDVSIPESVTTIGDKAFVNCYNLTGITLPSSIKSIGADAFLRCNALTRVDIFDISSWCAIEFGNYSSNPLYYAESLYLNGELVADLKLPDDSTIINNFAFYRYDKLKSIVISGGITSIGEGAFKDCSNLRNVTMENNVSSIGNSAFYGCKSLIKIDWNAKSVSGFANDNQVFYNAGIDGDGIEVVFGESVETLPDNVFTGNQKLKSVVIGNSVKKIGKNAFINCINLTDISFGNKISNIGEKAFYGCSGLTAITIPENIIFIKSNAFAGCANLAEINWNVKNTNKLIDGVGIFKNSGNNESGLQVIFGSNVECVPDGLFYNCTSLTNVIFGSNVTSIGRSAFESCGEIISINLPDSITNIGNRAFAYCTKLNGVVLPDSVETVGDEVFYNCTELENVIIGNNVTSIEKSAFAYCTKINTIIMPDSVATIEAEAFYNCTELENAIIGKNVTSIGKSAFAYCNSLVDITVPDSVTSVGNMAFAYCTGLTKINWNVTIDLDFEADSNVFCDAGKRAEVIFGNNIKHIPSYMFYSSELSLKPSISIVTIPPNVESIGKSAFERLTNVKVNIYDIAAWCGIDFYNENSNPLKAYGELWLNGKLITNLVIPENVKCINAYSFYGYDELTEVTIPDSVTDIGEASFGLCEGLKSITIPDSITYIGKGAFAYCTSVTKITWNVTKMVDFESDSNIFKSVGIDGIGTNITFGNNVEHIPAYLLYADKQNLPSYKYNNVIQVTIPPSIKSIGSSAFENCTSISEVHIQDISVWCNIDFYNGYSNPLCYADSIYANGELVSDLVIPDTVTQIKSYVFYGAWSLQSITIPDSVTSIGYRAFYGCTNLKTVIIGCGVDNIGSEAFRECTKLTRINWNAQVVSDLTGKSHVFYNAGTSGDGIEVIFGDDVKVIPSHLFDIDYYSNYGNPSINPNVKSVFITNSVYDIGYGAFADCRNLKIVYYKGTQEEYNSIDISNENTYFKSAVKKFFQNILVLGDDGKTFTVANKNLDEGNIVIFIFYNGNGIADIQTAVYIGSEISFNANCKYTEIKVMVWKSITNLKPLYKPEIVQ